MVDEGKNGLLEESEISHLCSDGFLEYTDFDSIGKKEKIY